MANLLEGLKNRLEEDSLMVEVDEEEGYSIRLTLDAMGDDEDGVVLMEISQVPLEEQANEFGYFHFFSVLAINVDEENTEKVVKNLNSMNVETLLGNYGVVDGEGMIYHRYVAKVPTGDEQAGIDYLYSSLVDVLAIIDTDYKKVVHAAE